jgi:hypothetical protein
MTTRTGLGGPKVSALAKVQVEEVLEALSDVDHVIVHAMSNNGYGMWQNLARCVVASRAAAICVPLRQTCVLRPLSLSISLRRQRPALASRVRGIVFDCGVMVGGDLGEEEWFHVFSKTTVGVMVMAEAIPDGPGGAGARIRPAAARIDVASRLLAKHVTGQGGTLSGDSDSSFDTMHAWQLANESPGAPPSRTRALLPAHAPRACCGHILTIRDGAPRWCDGAMMLGGAAQCPHSA